MQLLDLGGKKSWWQRIYVMCHQEFKELAIPWHRLTLYLAKQATGFLIIFASTYLYETDLSALLLSKKNSKPIRCQKKRKKENLNHILCFMYTICIYSNFCLRTSNSCKKKNKRGMHHKDWSYLVSIQKIHDQFHDLPQNWKTVWFWVFTVWGFFFLRRGSKAFGQMLREDPRAGAVVFCAPRSLRALGRPRRTLVQVIATFRGQKNSAPSGPTIANLTTALGGIWKCVKKTLESINLTYSWR